MKAFLKTIFHLIKRIFGVHSKSFDCRVDTNGDGNPDVIVSITDCDNSEYQNNSHEERINNNKEE